MSTSKMKKCDDGTLSERRALLEKHVLPKLVEPIRYSRS